jgi:hypothetical protein
MTLGDDMRPLGKKSTAGDFSPVRIITVAMVPKQERIDYK